MDLTAQVHTSWHQSLTKSLACRTVLMGLSLLRASLINLILVLLLVLMVDQGTECHPPLLFLYVHTCWSDCMFFSIAIGKKGLTRQWSMATATRTHSERRCGGLRVNGADCVLLFWHCRRSFKKARGPKCKVKMHDNPPEGTETGDADTAIFHWC